jgi:DNA-binding MarR family transcriptional regulator
MSPAFLAFAQADLKNEDRKVWAIMMCYVDDAMEIRHPFSAMAEELGIRPSNFSRALNNLCDEGIFIRRKRNGRTVQIWLNTEYGLNTKNHVVALDDARKNRESKT